jgi:anti-sigma-K factor RskA
MSEQTDIHTLAGAYVLDAVDDIERAAFDRHLRQCSACAVEVAELQMTTERLVAADAVEPPQRMRAAVMAEVARTPQQRPTRTGRQPATATRWRRWTAASVAAAILSIGVGVTTWSVAERQVEQQVEQQRQLAADVRSVLSAADVRMLATSSTVGGRLTLFVSRSQDAVVAVIDQFANPGDGHAYQLWMIDGNSFQSVGILEPDAGSGTHYFRDLRGATVFGVTREPAAGSREPTSQPVATVDLSR